MRRIFADTSFYQALLHRRDRWHTAAAAILGELHAEIITTDYVLVELAALMSSANARALFTRFVEHLRSDPSTTLVRTSPELFDEGLALFAARPDKEWSLVDCISFALMQTRGISEALAADLHFE